MSQRAITIYQAATGGRPEWKRIIRPITSGKVASVKPSIQECTAHLEKNLIELLPTK
jgi:hypothetical protein